MNADGHRAPYADPWRARLELDDAAGRMKEGEAVVTTAGHVGDLMAIKVLIVDDSKLARMAVAKALRSLEPNWVGVEATNADEALALVKNSPADLALLDFNMPGRDGLSLAAELLAMSPTLPVAVISANVQREIVARTGEVGAHFLAKPLTQQALGAFLDEAKLKLKR
jgi:CheY-like chemotaxis protein